jgi:hypothetical protein
MTQNTPTIYQRLEKLEGELQKLTNTVYALKVTDIQNYDKNFEELSVSAALRAERIACQMRNLVCPALSPNQAAYLPKVADAQGMRIAEQQGFSPLRFPDCFRNEESTQTLHFSMNRLIICFGSM